MIMNENGLQNRHSLASKSAAIAAVQPGGTPNPPASADAVLALRTFTPLPRMQLGGGSFKKRTTMFATRGGAVSLWSCGVVIGIIFCLMNTQVMAFPLEEAQVDKRTERSERSISDHALDQMALDWFLKRTDDQKDKVWEVKNRVARAVSDQILAEIEAQWITDSMSADGSQASSGRSRRFAAAHQGEDEERAKSRRSFADQRLADFLVRQRLRQSKGGGGNRDRVLDFNRLGRA